MSFVIGEIEDARRECHSPVLLVEQRIDASEYVDGCFGTADMPTHVVLHRCAVTGLTQTSVALAEQVTTIDKAQLQNRVGAVLDEQLMEQITHALQVQIGAVDAG